MARNKIPTSRVARTAKLSSLAAGQAARQVGTYAANIARGREANRALEQRNLEAAEQIVQALGTMKGAAMKLGQVMSFIDVGLIPKEYRNEFQLKLAQLRDSAPEVSFDSMVKVIESDLEQPVEDLFADFDPNPIAAASIGQVYKARLHDGREVAVKVQYPGVATAVRADLKNVGLMLRLMKRLAPGMDSKAMAREVQTRVGDELDYELEAQNQRSIARIFRGHPFITVPEVVTSLSRERVIVSEYMVGKKFEQLKELPDDERNRVGEIIFRFFFGCLYRHQQFSGDPHPGNFQLLDDGRMVFMDFGLFKKMSTHAVQMELEVQRLGSRGDAEKLFELFKDSGFITESKWFSAEGVLEQYLDAAWWYLSDETVSLNPEVATAVMLEMSDPRSRHFSQMRHETLSADHLFARRMEMLTLAVLGQLHVSANWFQVASEWIFSALPVTELGRQEAEFYGRF